ncbi:hypothetical protein TRFO_06733 [Tritrichomonas foetus]|uniref:Uncharacterized protein n=1 Tax=Tritrichomonas foetus TaxID=1144522 RepID=A0A1J4K140_9EUKA|nr:hypothetical protein TRFO_06733 [Tritrichomonas foetus]|eukprot:OHT03470.1 hypothetical protein TRFO_06733 [Tritrichomonas foetus]
MSDDYYDDISIQDIDFFAALKEVESQFSNKKVANKLFKSILNHEKISDQKFKDKEMNKEYQTLKNYVAHVLKPRKAPANTKEIIYSNYIQTFKKNSKPEIFQQFLFFVQLYSIGKIGHQIFINLVLNLFPDENLQELPQIKSLPSFMACFNQPSLTCVGIRKGSKYNDICAEILIGLTSASQNDPVKLEVVSKCMQSLAMGLIDRDTAKFWLSKYFHPNLYSKLDELTEFEQLMPSRFQPDLIPNIEIDHRRETVTQLFINQEILKYSMKSINPVVLEIIESKLQIIYNIFEKVRQREKVMPNTLIPFFGNSSSKISQLIIKGKSNKELNLLSDKYDEYRRAAFSFLTQYLKSTNIQNPDYRYIYNNYLRTLNFVGFYTIPGVKTINFKSPHHCFVATAFVNEFIKVYFGEETSEKLLSTFEKIMPLFDTRPKAKFYKALTVDQTAVLLYLYEISKLILESGDVNDIQVILSNENEDNDDKQSIPYFDMNENHHDFAQLVCSIPSRMKNKEEMPQIVTMACPLLHVDLPLTKLCRHLNKSFMKKEELNSSITMMKTSGLVILIKDKFEGEDATITLSVIPSIMK